MIEVYKNLFIGNLEDCQNNNLVKVHACKIPCHQNGVGYSRNLSSSHPYYLILENENDLYLNLVDMNSINSHFTNPIFKKAFEFIEKNLNENKKTLIHCNLGQSRSSSIGIFYLAKKGIIKNTSFEEAYKKFKELYNSCELGTGFYNYLKNNWKNLMEL